MDQIQILQFLQAGASPLWDTFFMWVTRLGNEEFFTVLIPVLYWSADRRFAFRLSYLFLGSMLANVLLKDTLQLPRPPEGSVRVLYKSSGTGFGFPSGHAQSATTLWGYLMARYPRRWLIVLGVTVIGLVSYSRLYLGLHYPTDVAGGVAIGVAAVVAFRALESHLGRIGRRGISPQRLMVLAGVVPLVALLFYRSEDAYKIAGFLSFLPLGHYLNSRFIRTEGGGRLGPVALHLVIGMAGLAALRWGSSGLLPEGPAQIIRYGAVSLWVTVAAPWLFARLGISRRQP